ncbi:MAG: M14 family metallopeptidase [marine benthic group bacterium]|nr:M14 family metallopeptidase [Gemmatimonadota bacterium]MCL7957981.1 M14 family metallopeptidase [Gemmatimonadota bacterium]MCL7973485.1 M14 family metallopeptidase [Gemmatimonadota bacterium]MCL7980032.1 M14 family metallopeptidase [Gemmatimonadota bacterium]MCL7983930.1 M14 family metallopeptidase [Gemmatimonadota bacterium]
MTSHLNVSAAAVNFIIGASLLALLPTAAWAQQSPPGAMAGLGAPPDPQVAVSWDRYFDHETLGEIGRRLEEAWPDRCRSSSIGRSVEGRDLWLLTVTDFQAGEADAKPAMWIDGNIHANEVQGSEIALYTAWYLCEMADRVDWIAELLRDRTFYIVPSINPDGRDNFLLEPNTPHSPRSGLAPRDDDGDGLFDEDDFDDLNGDGHITMMRRRSSNGRWITSPEDPRIMVRAHADQPGEWELLGNEGFDNDGDGRVNEDRRGYYDPNRNWPWRWAPAYVQSGSDAFPTSLPETRAVVEFVLAHPNIAAAQTYHNTGGMILRGPGTESDSVQAADLRVMDEIGERGEMILPGYRYISIWEDLYTTWGNELDWFYAGRGIITFSNELWTSFNYFRESPENERWDRADYRFDRYLLFGEAIVPWTPVDHPQYGRIEVGGVKRQYTRAIPGFLLREEAHRNMAFTLYQAGQMPLVRVDSVEVRSLGSGVSEVRALISNRKLAPTRTEQDVVHGISPPDRIRIEGGRVIAGFRIENPLQGIAEEQEHRPERIEVERIDGMGTVAVKWLVRGSGPFTVTVESAKGGKHSLRSP